MCQAQYEAEVRSSTLCWNCNAQYGIDEATCPKCGAANGNVDFDLAMYQAAEPIEGEYTPEPSVLFQMMVDLARRDVAKIQEQRQRFGHD